MTRKRRFCATFVQGRSTRPLASGCARLALKRAHIRTSSPLVSLPSYLSPSLCHLLFFSFTQSFTLCQPKSLTIFTNLVLQDLVEKISIFRQAVGDRDDLNDLLASKYRYTTLSPSSSFVSIAHLLLYPAVSTLRFWQLKVACTLRYVTYLSSMIL